jgi:bifunctional N-acetylglucosamine-1-phosphate-uridyltransferase/glucosamine-1-phosphate-acetyltransferase GlmU-like protein
MSDASAALQRRPPDAAGRADRSGGGRRDADELGLPKPLHELGGRPLVAHALAAGRALDPAKVIVVTGHGAEAVEAAVQRPTPTRSACGRPSNSAPGTR